MTLLLRRGLTLAVVAAVLSLAVIGIVRATSPAGSGSLPAAAATAAPTDGAEDALAAGLDAVLAADEASPSAATGPGDRVALRGQLRRLAAWQRLVHATVVVDLPNRGLTTVQLDHGTVAAVSATALTIKESGGASVALTLGDETRVRRAGAKGAIADLKIGDDVFAMSRVEAGGTAAYLVVVPKG